MRETIGTVAAWAVRVPRVGTSTLGTAGSPARPGAAAGAHHQWASTYRTVYSDHLETTLVRIETSGGLVGWGEAQAPVAPEVARTIVETLLGPLVTGEDALAPEALWDRMYAAMRVRGHTGGFLLDAMAGIDLAVWDVCGKAYGQPVYRLLGGPCHDPVPVYVSGLAGASREERVRQARDAVERGARALKLFVAADPADCLADLDALRDALDASVALYVDALWRFDLSGAARFAQDLAAREVGWLEAPLAPEDVGGHAALAQRSPIPIAIGESYRTRFEILPFFQGRAVGVLQPDLGRSGLTEARKLAALAGAFHVPVAPHVSIGLGPQLAAARHFAASIPDLLRLECNPDVCALANRFLRSPLDAGVGEMSPPGAPGLGVEPDEAALRRYVV